MGVPPQVVFVIVTPRYLILSTFSMIVPSSVGCTDPFELFSSQLHHTAFDGLESHALFPSLFIQAVSVTLKFNCVLNALNLTITDTIISKQTNLRISVIYLCHWYIMKTTTGPRQCPVVPQTKQVPIQWKLYNRKISISRRGRPLSWPLEFLWSHCISLLICSIKMITVLVKQGLLWLKICCSQHFSQMAEVVAKQMRH